MLSCRDLLECVIEPVLKGLDADSTPARKLMLGTALAESGLKHLRQMGGGAALGLWQMESATHDDIWRNWLDHRPQLRGLLRNAAPGHNNPSSLTWNLKYACAMARIHYLRVQEAIPTTTIRQASYWKLYYNTPEGRGTVDHYLRAWESAEC